MKSIAMLRVCIAIVFVWFGLLKVFGVSPVGELIHLTYPSFPEPQFIMILGILETVIGVGLFIPATIKYALILFFVQMAGIFFGLVLAPSVYFHHSMIWLLTTYGEFVIKNIILVSAGLVIWQFEVSGY